jgi:hypothetical protein
MAITSAEGLPCHAAPMTSAGCTGHRGETVMIEPVAFAAVAVMIKAVVCALTAIVLGFPALAGALFGPNSHRPTVTE